jgi:hypothetical protein
MTRSTVWLLVPVAFLAALAGVFVGRVAFPADRNAGVDLHAVLHDKLTLDAEQERRLEVLEADFAARRRALENQLRSDNRRLAAAMQAEHRNGPEVSAAIDASHLTMGRLQKETVAHVFAMRALLREDQAPIFDQAIIEALIEEPR